MLTYRSKGPHTNRKGGKTKRTATDRTGKPLAEKPEKRKRPTKKEIAQVAAQAASDMSGQMAEDQARFSAEHDKAVAEGSAMMNRNMAGTPGKAQGIIKRRRV